MTNNDNVMQDTIAKALRGEKTERVSQVRYNSTKPGAPNKPKINRKAPCPCGSGTMYKRCCYGDHTAAMNKPTGLPAELAPKTTIQI